MLTHAAPGAEGVCVNEKGVTLNVKVLGKVTSTAMKDLFALQNVTQVDHKLYPEAVLRMVEVSNGMLGIKTCGIGNGFLPFLNNWLGIEVWKKLDQKVLTAFVNQEMERTIREILYFEQDDWILISISEDGVHEENVTFEQITQSLH